MSILEILAIIFLGVPLVLGVIGVIILKIKEGKSWIGQGYGRK